MKILKKSLSGICDYAAYGEAKAGLIVAAALNLILLGAIIGFHLY